MGYLRGVMHGLVIGGAVALMYAPKPGRQMRTDLSEKLDQMRGQMQPVIDQAQGVVESARPQVERGISKAQQQASKITRRDGNASGSSYAGPASVGSGGVPGPGV
jgi:gas vesicle protein